MKYLKMTFKYIDGRFFYLLAIAIAPAILAGFTVSVSGLFDFIVNLKSSTYQSFMDVYMQILGRPNFWLYFSPLGFIALAIALSLNYSAVDRHMRIGSFSVSDVWHRIDYNLLASAKYIFLLAIFYHIAVLLISSLCFMWYKFFTANVAITFSIITIFIFGMLIIFMISMLLLWLPVMLHTGLTGKRAFIMAIKTLSGNFMRMLGIGTLIALPIIILMIINSVLHWHINIALDSTLYAIILIFYPILMNVVYYDLNNIKRVDLTKKSIWSKRAR